MLKVKFNYYHFETSENYMVFFNVMAWRSVCINPDSKHSTVLQQRQLSADPKLIVNRHCHANLLLVGSTINI